MKMSMEVQEQSPGMDEDRQHPKYKMPPKLKKIERELKGPPEGESLHYLQQMQKVPPVIRSENGSNDYDPMVVALGPYHHGKKNLQAAETLKSKALQHIIIDTEKSVQFFFDAVFEQVNHVRSFYVEDPKKKVSDSVFAQMMLLDACFVISYILAPTKPKFASTILSDPVQSAPPSGNSGESAPSGDSAQTAPSVESATSGESAQSAPSGDSVSFDFAIIYRDMLLLENQIPLWFLKLVNALAYGSEAVDLLDEFIYRFSDFPRNRRKDTARYKEASHKQASHFLDAYRQALLLERETSAHSCCKFRFGWPKWTDEFPWLMTCSAKEKYDDDFIKEKFVPCFHSASDLRAKGIYFKPNRDNSLMGLCFWSGCYYGELRLPILHLSTHTPVFFSNLIAYESCLKATEPKFVTAYIKFMKSLVVHTNDVKELRANGILFTSLRSDEEVVKMFKELNTSTLSTEKTFEDVRRDIQKHFRSKFKPRVGDFLYTYFRSPWTAIASIAAAFLLLLTVAQTYFTIWGS